jgi:hypothetical protein
MQRAATVKPRSRISIRQRRGCDASPACTAAATRNPTNTGVMWFQPNGKRTPENGGSR